jgi:hypothetical protein
MDCSKESKDIGSQSAVQSSKFEITIFTYGKAAAN